MQNKVLIIDDDEPVREELKEYLENSGYGCQEASCSASAIKTLHEESELTIVLVDIRMPGENGLEFITTAKAEIHRNIEFIIITGHGGTTEAVTALRLGIRDFLAKPIDPKYLLQVVKRADHVLHLHKSEVLFQESLKEEVEAKALEVRSLLDDLGRAYEEALDILAVAVEYKDSDTGNHIKRIGAYAGFMASELGWEQQRKEMIELAAPLHDVGKIGIPDAVLIKPEKLNKEEIEVVHTHCEIGHRILSRSSHPVMHSAATIALTHHEKWDGSGYPNGLKGEEIPIEGRIVAIADVYDALRSERPYKAAFSHEKSMAIILQGDGRTAPGHFDPMLLDIFRKRAETFAEIFDKLADPPSFPVGGK